MSVFLSGDVGVEGRILAFEGSGFDPAPVEQATQGRDQKRLARIIKAAVVFVLCEAGVAFEGGDKGDKVIRQLYSGVSYHPRSGRERRMFTGHRRSVGEGLR
ncbi:hypothetical protein [Gloeobacter violaceus]|nr:hypothetical protein [Gloeobacter violaceus]